ncbi:M16 family metallopeptidase [Polyangium spumosum]|uniref:Insulinase family protein n=1 Tax=Polyangium spumosum TaxID=889282 RepID=A0A6N7PI34_9BACT|nr:pitrilysin family protein [Polyangium spumosum]MRG91467.1 insulinase family protein [Polyangium spumosum]
MLRRNSRRAAFGLVSLALIAVPTGLSLAQATADAPPATAAAAGSSMRVSLPFEKFVLPNGLEVILHEDHRTPVVAVNVWYHVGSKDEGPGRNGFAHLFEHVMFQGSRNVGEDQFFRYLERAGASDRNGTTNTDRTNYYETVPSGELGLALWLESDRMGYLLDHANDETFKSQREVVKNERRQNYENAPYGLVRQFIRGTLFPKTHPYHRLTIGTPQDLDAATFDDVRDFFKRYYVPNNATLVIAGDFQPAKAKELVTRYFAGLPRGADPKPVRGPVPSPLTKETRLDVEAGVTLPRLVISWTTPPHFVSGDAELDMVSDVLASGKSSRLYKRLVYDMQIAQSVSAAQESAELGSVFEITVTLQKDKNLDEVFKVVDEELDKLRAAPPAAEELDRARTRTLSGLVFSAERVTGRADLLNMYNRRVGDPGFFEKDLARYQKVTAGDVTKALATYLPKDKRVVTFVRPVADAPRAGRLVGGTP